MSTEASARKVVDDRFVRRLMWRRRVGALTGWVLNLLGLAVLVLVFATPMIWVITNSLRPESSVMSSLYPVTWKTFAPVPFTFFSYLELLGLATDRARIAGYTLLRNLWISLASGALVVLLTLIFSTCAAYFFARLKFPYKPVLMAYIMGCMMIPEQVVIVPTFLVAMALGLVNTFWALVIPFYASPFVTFALAQFLSDIPYELDEAAIMDGANPLQVLYLVLVPNAVPALMTVGLLEFQYIWNNFYWPLVAITYKRDLPIQVAVSGLIVEVNPQWSRVLAGMVFASLPVIILFMFLQRYYYENISLTGLKG